MSKHVVVICILARDCSRLYSVETVPVSDLFRAVDCVIQGGSFERYFTSGKLPTNLEVLI